MMKMYCVVNKEALKAMNGNRGKLGAQTGHAFLHSFWNSEQDFPELASAYKNSERAYKIVLITDTEEDLHRILADHQEICGTTLVKDAAFTVFDKPTVTCIGIGPIDSDNVLDSLKELKVLI